MVEFHNALYRRHVMWPQFYDEVGIHQFDVMRHIGLRQNHTLLDIGCGSLCGGRYLMLYLDPGHYTGLDPAVWAIHDVIENELGPDFIAAREAAFFHFSSWGISSLIGEFDFLLAHSIFTHTSHAETQLIMSEAMHVMNDESRFVATYYYGSIDTDAPEWVYPAGVSYRHDTIERLANEAGLSVERLDIEHPVGHTWIVMRKK